MKFFTIILLMGLLSFSLKKGGLKKLEAQRSETTSPLSKDASNSEPVSYNDQIQILKSLGYEFEPDVTKEMILYFAYEISWEDDAEKYIQDNPFSVLYQILGWRDPRVKNYNFSNKCVKFDLEFFDPNSQYKWFMERLGAITNGEIQFTDIEIETDSENWEWIVFKVNGVSKRWKLEKSGYIADHFVQRFSNLPKELKAKGKYTFYSDGSQQWVIDYATEEEQIEFNKKTGLKREWLGEGNHFSDPPKE